MCYLRRRFVEQFADFAGRTCIGDTCTFYFDNIGAEDVKLFLLKQTHKSYKSSEAINIFCRAGSDQQAQQSTHLAEGLNPLQLNFSGFKLFIMHALLSQTVFDFLLRRHQTLLFYLGHHGLLFAFLQRLATKQSA